MSNANMKAEVDKKIEMKAAAEELQQNQRDIEKTAKAATKEIKNVIIGYAFSKTDLQN